MSDFKVVEIIDGDILKLSPGWIWKLANRKIMRGQTIKIIGIRLPRERANEFNFAVEKLKKLLLNNNISIKNTVILPQDQAKSAEIGGRVLLNDVDIANYFPEYKV